MSNRTRGVVRRLGTLLVVASLSTIAGVASPADAALPSAPRPERADPPAAPSSTTAPRTAVQTAAGRVKVTGPGTVGATKLRLLQDGSVVAEMAASGALSRTFDRTGVTTGLHSYSFQAGNAGGWGPESGAVTVTVVDTPVAPSAPTLTQVNDTTLSVSITPVTGATSYVIYVNGTRAATVKAKAGTDPILKKVNKLTVNQSHAVTVAAANIAGAGSVSSATTLTLRPQMKKVAPPRVTDGTVQTGLGAVTVAAKPTAGAVSHTLVVDGVASNATATVGADKVSFDLTGLTEGDHDFAITATNPGYTVTSSVLKLAVRPAPSASSDLKITQTSDTVAKLSFTPGANATTVKVYFDGVLLSEPKVPKGATTMSVTLPAMVALSSHTAAVTSANVVGSSASSSTLSFSLHPILPATTGQPAAVQTGDGSVRLTIPATTSATTYSLLQDGISVEDATASSGTVTFDVTSLPAGRRYSFEVVAKNPRSTAPKSKFVSITVWVVLDDAPDVTVTPTYGAPGVVTAAVSLAPLPGATGYRIYVDGTLSTTKYEPLTLVTGRATVNLTLDSSVDHDVEVRGFNLYSPGPMSSPVTVPADPG